MKVLRLEKSSHPRHWQQLYERDSTLADQSFADQLAVYCRGGIQYAGTMSRYLTDYGHEVTEIYTDVPPLQRAWAREHGLEYPAIDPIRRLAFEQIRECQPDVLYIQDLRTLDTAFIREARSRFPCIKIVTGFICSPSYDLDTLCALTFVLTCTREYLAEFKAAGATVYFAQHVFDPHQLELLDMTAPRTRDIVFSGSLFRHQHGHWEREAVLEAMAGFPGLEIFCPQADLSYRRDLADTALRCGAYAMQRALQAAGVSHDARRTLPVIGRAATWPGWPMRQLNRHLQHFMKPPVFGVDMLEALRSARVCLNVVDHKEAANWRLFEVTGVGSCLLTSYRDNMSELFEPDTEAVLYKSPAECRERARWLLDHPADAERIAAAGHQRTLRDHTYAKRAAILDELFRKYA
ncbi:MAG: glycosyltransferase [Gemmatimonadaceae bacterium]